MRQILNRILFNRRISFVFMDGKRFKGHSKWDNIKHVKAANDRRKMLLFQHFKLQMKIAIQEHGSTKPDNNFKLAQVIEQAKKSDMPHASIKSFLEKMEARKIKTQEGIAEVQGPSGYIMLVHYTTDNMKLFQMELNHKLKKCRGKIATSSVRNMFTHVGYIVVEKKGTLELATEDAIIVGAEDVEEFEEKDNKYFQFKCDPKDCLKIKKLLNDRQYCVTSVIEDYEPHIAIELSEPDLKSVSELHEKITSLEDVNNIYDNLA